MSLLAGKAYQVNVRNQQHVEQMTTEIVKEFNGRLDVFIANAGIPWTQGAMLDGEVKHYHDVVNTDLDSTFYCARIAGQIFIFKQKAAYDMAGNKIDFKQGSFVATASMSGHV